ncbi:hypothetical protein FRC07_004293 [Ceratobasidium sp. 392]|nr:hypothetical protein FRC07_004293 [Ceratobasidium sp. 392]
MIVAMLGVLKTGASYVPLDGGIVPDTTLAHIISDANIRVVLTVASFTTRLASHGVSVYLLDECFPEVAVSERSAHEFTGHETAYIVYTSGTTGNPKGIEVTHRNVLNLITHSPGNLGMKSGMRVSQLLNLAFDMAQWECLGSVDIVISTPSCLGKYTPADFQPKAIATASEPCPQVLADRWIASGTKFYNCCGPTETTTVNMVYEHTKVGQKLSIGRPTPNNNIYILDDDMKPVPIGDAGVIWAGGSGVARGYLNLPEKTASSFRPDLFANNGGMMYSTGDLGKWHNDGSGLLDILGRVDDQVKIKGFRVELNGVAATMETVPGVHTAVALLIDDELVGVYVPDFLDEETVNLACTTAQPYYARPSRYVKLSKMPTTYNGERAERERNNAEDATTKESDNHDNISSLASPVPDNKPVAPSNSATDFPENPDDVRYASRVLEPFPHTLSPSVLNLDYLGADLQFTKSDRLDICMVKNLPIALVFLPAADIPRFVGESNVDLGITGQDVILESKMQTSTKEILPLGFGQCKLQVQVPVRCGIEREKELAGKRIATSFEVVAGEYFDRIDAHTGTKTRIEHIGGSVETACILGLADGIVDLVESGETMRAAGLKPIGTIMSSEAVLIFSSRPKKPHMLALVKQLKSRLAGVVASSKYVLCQYNVRRDDLPKTKAVTPGRRSITVSLLDKEGWVAVSSMVGWEKAAMVMDGLQAVGAEESIMLKIENCRV